MINLEEKAIQEHKEKMQKIQDEMGKVKSKRKYLELKKCYHRLERDIAYYLSKRYADELIIKR